MVLRARAAGIVPRLLSEAPTLPGVGRFTTNTGFGESYWMAGGRQLFLSSGARVLRDIRETLGVGGDFAWTPAIVTRLREALRSAGPQTGPNASAFDREYITPLASVNNGAQVSLHELRCALWLTYSRSEWSQGPRVIQFPFETGMPRYGEEFAEDSPPSVQTPTSVVDGFDPEELTFNPFSGQRGTFTGGGSARDTRNRQSSSDNGPMILAGAILLAVLASGGGSRE